MESIQFDDDETPFTSQPAPGEDPCPAEDSLGNRPAAGARQGTPEQILGGGVQSVTGGDDFLGLTEEMEVLDDELAAAVAEPQPAPIGPGELMQTADEPQLFDLDQAEGQAQLGMAPEKSADDIDLGLLAPDPELGEEAHHLVGHQDEVEAGLLDEEHEPQGAFEEEEWELEGEEFQSGGRGKRLALVAVAFALGGGLFAAKHFLLQGSFGAPTALEVAQGPRMQPMSAGVSANAQAVSETAQPDLTAAGTTQYAPLGSARDSLALTIANTLGMPLVVEAMNMARDSQPAPPLAQAESMSSAQETEEEPAETLPTAAELASLDAQPQLDTEPAETSPDVVALVPEELAAQVESGVPTPEQAAVLTTDDQRSETSESGTSFLLQGYGDEEQPTQRSSSDLPLDPRIATTWLSEEVPEEFYEHDVQVQTPVVGEVRVILGSGDVFEGRLVSVGEGRIWLSNDLGRFALDSSAVDTVQRLVEASEGDLASMDDLLPGERVTVKLPGGTVSGRIVATQGTRITLVTASGARLTLDDPEIEIASRGSAISLGRSERDD